MECAQVELENIQDSKGVPRSWRSKLWPLVRITLGLLLISSAVLKLLDGPDTADSPRFLFAAVAEIVIPFELLMGCWSLSGYRPRALRVALFCTFSVLAASSLSMAFAGRTSCGCFGQSVPVSPWNTLMLDLGALALLLCSKPPQRLESQVQPAMSAGYLLRPILGAIVLVSLIIGGVAVATHSLPLDVILSLRGEPLTIEPAEFELGDVYANTARTIAVRLHNHSKDVIEIFGGASDCSCVVTNDLPAHIPPHGYVDVSVTMRGTGPKGAFVHRFILYANQMGESRVVWGSLTGQIVPGE